MAQAIVKASQANSTRRSALKKRMRPQRPTNSQPNCSREYYLPSQESAGTLASGRRFSPVFGFTLALQPQSAGDLGEERERTDAPPQLTAEHQQDEEARGHHQSPEQGGAQGVGGFVQADALQQHAVGGDPQGAPGVVGRGEAGRERVVEQGKEDQDPAGGERPAHQMHPPFRHPVVLPAQHRRRRP
jgi:hypothetical protein